MNPPTFLDAAARHTGRIAIVADRAYSYGELAARASGVAQHLQGDTPTLAGARVAYLVAHGMDRVSVQWGIWLAGGIAVPLALSHPPAELHHVLEDSGSSVVIADRALADRLDPTRNASYKRIHTDELPGPGSFPTPSAVSLPADNALIVYTSGTTGKPKGVVITHANIDAQVASLHEAWAWSEHDRILLVLPLHHVHGLVNVVCCALWAGACCEVAERFDATHAWERLASGDLTLFMAVPTIYRKLIAAWEGADRPTQRRYSSGAQQFRLMVSGSAALPVSVYQRWKDITGHTLLERYGMTETGMALSNPLHGERRAGTVGQPLPGVDVKLRPDPDARTPPDPSAEPAEILVRGATVFGRYWGRPDETAAAFEDGWFKTGDTAVVEDGYYRILGRNSVDIIKTGGYKVSALEIEEICRTHNAIGECAVVGVPDDKWGERVCIAVECVPKHRLALDDLMAFCRARLAPYKVPRDLRVVTTLPRNAMGKVTKPVVAGFFETKE